MPDELLDPRQAFLDRQSAVQEAPVIMPDTHKKELVEIAMALSAGFMAYRILSAKWLLEQEAPKTDKDLFDLLGVLARKRWWMNLLFSGVEQAYRLGSISSPKEISGLVQRQMALEYTDTLGEYINNTSGEALMEGYRAQLNAGWNERVAWERVTQGFGLDRNQMRQWLTPQSKNPVSYQREIISSAAHKAVNKLLMFRAERIGNNEAFHAMQVAKSLYWMHLQTMGDLPPEAQKQWITAQDERVCPLCAPLDGVSIPFSEQFAVGEVKMWAPGAHPKCRCEIAITYKVDYEVPEDASELGVLQKNMPDDPYNRNKDGEFAPKEGRNNQRLDISYASKDDLDYIRSVIDEVTTTNPFTSTANPFASTKTNPFASDTVDPFAKDKVNPFAETKVNPFADTTVNPFAQAKTDSEQKTETKPSLKYIVSVVFVNGKPQFKQEPVNAEEPKNHRTEAYVSGHEFLMHYEMAQQLDDSLPNLSFRKGEIINFSVIGKEQPSSLDKNGSGVSPVPGFISGDASQALEHVVYYIESPYVDSGRPASDEALDDEYDVRNFLRALTMDELIETAKAAIYYGADKSDISYGTNRVKGSPYAGMGELDVADILYTAYTHEGAYGPLTAAIEESRAAYADNQSTEGGSASVETPIVFRLHGWNGGEISERYASHINRIVIEAGKNDAEYVVESVEEVPTASILGSEHSEKFNRVKIVNMRLKD